LSRRGLISTIALDSSLSSLSPNTLSTERFLKLVSPNGD
jgi:hypothetical protein